jgi:hypothetical protein
MKVGSRWSPACPRRENPKGASALPVGQPPAGTAGTHQREKAQEPRSIVPGDHSGDRLSGGRKRYVGAPVRQRTGTSGGDKLRRVKPMSAAGINGAGTASRGVNRREGNQTLRAERSGQAKPAAQWTLVGLMCCRAAKL